MPNMQDYIWVTGIILKQSPVGEYDRRICLLTKERGKISAFARGARKPAGKTAAGSNPFSFGKFKLYEGRNSYNLEEADISNYFEFLRTDYEAACYGMYFAEVADYCTRENNDEREMLKLLYQSLRALEVKSIPDKLVKCIFEIRTIVANGEFEPPPDDYGLSQVCSYTIRYISQSSIEKLYTFTLDDKAIEELENVTKYLWAGFTEHEFKSLEILKTLC